jgi:uncharacterized protein (DUF1330 family)
LSTTLGDGCVLVRSGQPADVRGRVRQDDVVTAYWITIYNEITDEAKVAAYADLAGPALRDAGGVYVARGLPELTYEAGQVTRTVVIQFESVEAARAAHESRGYQEALAVLDGGAVRDMRIVPGTRAEA